MIYLCLSWLVRGLGLGSVYRNAHADSSDWQDIGRDFWHSKQRERKSRIVNVDGHQVLRENMYDINSVSRCHARLPLVSNVPCAPKARDAILLTMLVDDPIYKGICFSATRPVHAALYVRAALTTRELYFCLCVRTSAPCTGTTLSFITAKLY